MTLKTKLRMMYIGLLIYGIVGLWKCVASPAGEPWLVLQTEAIVAAGFVYIWYAIETWRLRIVAETQIDMSRAQLTAMTRPVVVAEHNGMGLVLKNIGSGPALNVFVEPLQLSPNVEWRVDKPKAPLSVGESALLAIRPFALGEPFGESENAPTHFTPGLATEVHMLTITYETIDGGTYSTLVEMSKEGYRITRIAPGAQVTATPETS